ncbi:hypothetical protein, partial [Burkholderia ubonensis]|uniref:hypothetical protein n=1 Tax=Burkholderia ubonensis TaxID=101571 RepID=UPI001E497AE2
LWLSGQGMRLHNLGPLEGEKPGEPHIFRLGSVFSEFNPVIFGLTMVILVTSVIIEIEKDPPTMDWVRQCLWGKENNYKNAAEEIGNFNKALNG